MKITIIIILLIIVATLVGLLIAFRGVKCPKCGGHMRMTDCTDTMNTWICQECGRRIIIEDYDE